MWQQASGQVGQRKRQAFSWKAGRKSVMSGHGALWRTDLSLVSYCDDINRFRRRVVPISRQIATIAKRDKNFSKGIQIWHRTPGLGCLSDRDEPIANGSHRPLGSTRIFINQEAPQAAKI